MTDLITQNAALRRLLDDRYARMHHEMCCVLVSSRAMQGRDWEDLIQYADFYIRLVKERENQI